MRRKWSPQSRFLMGLAIVLASATFLLVKGWVGRIEAQAPGERVGVWVATDDVAAGTVLSDADLRATQVPSAWVPRAAATAASQLVGRRTLGPAGEGEIWTTARVSGSAGPLAALVPEGLRAVVVSGGLPSDAVAPGDRVDVLATFGGGQPYTDTVGEGLEVLQVLPPGTDPADGAGLVLLADPATAERLAHARAFAELSVSILGSAG